MINDGLYYHKHALGALLLPPRLAQQQKRQENPGTHLSKIGHPSPNVFLPLEGGNAVALVVSGKT